MKNKKCDHKNFWEIYKIINFNRTFWDENWRKFKCSKCNKKCILKWKWYKKMKKNPIKRFFTYFLWLIPGFLVIYLAFTQVISYICAIILITIFHFLAMYLIIKSDRLVVKEK